MRELKLENGSIDLDDKAVIATSFQLADVFDLTTRKSNYTNRFKALPTDNNKRLLEFSNDESSGTNVPYTSLPVKYLVEGMEVMQGSKLTVESADDTGFNLEIFAGCKEFFELLGDKTLEDLVFAPTDDNYAGNMGIFEYAFINTVTGVDMTLNPLPDARKLLLSYKKILEAIISNNGYTKTGDVFADASLAALHVFPLGYRGQNNQRLRDNISFKANFSGTTFGVTTAYQTIPFNNVVSGNAAGYWNGTTFITPDPTGALGAPWFTYNIRANLTILNAVFLGGVTLVFQVLHNGVVVATNPITPGGVYPASLTIQAENINGGQGFQFEVRILVNFGTATITLDSSTFVEVTVNTAHPAVDYRNALGMMPENIKQKDFFREFAVRFGVLFSENNNLLTCKTYGEILTDQSNAVDWSDKRVSEQANPKKFDFAGKYGQNNYFRYGIESTDEAVGKDTGVGNLTIPNTNLEFKKDLFTSMFAASLTQSSGNSLGGYINCMKATWVEGETDLQLRLVMIRSKYGQEPTLAGGVAAYNVAYFIDSDSPYDCGFQGVIDNQYAQLRQAFSKTKIISRKYNLSIVDIAMLDQFKLVNDSGAYYLLLKIANYVKDKTTNVELLRL